MESYCIVTDATVDLGQDIIDRMGITVIPMEFMLGKDVYTHYADARELELSEFYNRLKAGEGASTSQIRPAQYEALFEKILLEGRDIIYISLSSGLSGTFGVASIVAGELRDRFADRRIECIDSLCASIGEGLLVILAAEQQKAGRSFDEVISYIEETKYKCCHWFMVEDLNQLKRGGRLKSWEAVIGTALRIHPILSTDREGRLRLVSKARGSKKAIHYLIDRLINDGYDISGQTVIVAHGNCQEYAEAIRNELVSRRLVKQCILSEIGPVIGSHTGTGMCAITFLGENYKA